MLAEDSHFLSHLLSHKITHVSFVVRGSRKTTKKVCSNLSTVGVFAPLLWQILGFFQILFFCVRTKMWSNVAGRVLFAGRERHLKAFTDSLIATCGKWQKKWQPTNESTEILNRPVQCATEATWACHIKCRCLPQKLCWCVTDYKGLQRLMLLHLPRPSCYWILQPIHSEVEKLWGFL